VLVEHFYKRICPFFSGVAVDPGESLVEVAAVEKAILQKSGKK